MKPTVLLVSHDAGGAELLAAWQRRNEGRFVFQHCLAGPARGVFARHHGETALAGIDAIDRLEPGSWVLTATSLESGLEREAIARAKSRGVRCVSFLDHWDLYRERFGTKENWLHGLPDEVWVGDEYGREHALRSGFPPERLTLVANPYFEWIREGEAARAGEARPSGRRILYVCEPLRVKLAAAFGDRALEYDDEMTSVRKFLESAGRFAGRGWSATLRPHPREDRAKYEGLAAGAPAGVLVSVSREPDLIADLRRHDLVVGVESMGLVIGLLLRKDVYSVVTGKPYEISLPHREIKRLAAYDRIFEAQEAL